jgi:formylmethanofuran dehydrogenase subunit E
MNQENPRQRIEDAVTLAMRELGASSTGVEKLIAVVETDNRNVIIQVPSYARIFASATCSVCGESVMEPRVR